jgi:Tfp pilus assembly protein PilX
MIPVLHDMRAGFVLVVALAMLVFICAVAGLGAVLRPVRWSERKGYR